MKKILPIIFSLSLICCSFTACGDKEKDSSSNSETPTIREDESSGLSSATDASMEDASDNPGDSANERATDSGIGNNLVTDAEGIVDDLVSTGEDIVDDAGSVVDGVGDAIMGTDNSAE